MGGLIEEEVKKVFVDRKWDPEERLNYWRGNQMSEATIQAKAEQQAIELADKQQADEWKNGIVMNAIPSGYTIDAEDAQQLAAADREFSRSSDVHSFNLFVQSVMVPRFYEKIRARSARGDGEDARLASMSRNT